MDPPSVSSATNRRSSLRSRCPRRGRRTALPAATLIVAVAAAVMVVVVPLAAARSAVGAAAAAAASTAPLRRRPRVCIPTAFVGGGGGGSLLDGGSRRSASCGGTLSPTPPLAPTTATAIRPQRRRFPPDARFSWSASPRDDNDPTGEDRKGGGRLSDFETEFFDSVEKDAPPTAAFARGRPPTTATAARPRGGLSDFEADFFDYVEPTEPRRPSVGAPPGRSGPSGSDGGGAPVASASRSSAAHALGRPAAAASSSSSFRRSGQTWEPTPVQSGPTASRTRPMTRHQQRQMDPRTSPARSQPMTPPARRPPGVAGAAAGGGSQRARAMPPPVSEYDYDYFDDQLGVSASFGEDVGRKGGGGSSPARPGRATATPPSPPTRGAAASASATAFWDDIEGVDDPDYDPYFSVDADAEGTTRKLPETEREARWAGEGNDNVLVTGSADGYGLLPNDSSGASKGAVRERRQLHIPPSDGAARAAGGTTTFRSAEDFLAGVEKETAAISPETSSSVASRSSVSLVENFDAKPDTSREITPRYDDAASVFGPSPPKQQNDQTQQDETEETSPPSDGVARAAGGTTTFRSAEDFLAGVEEETAAISPKTSSSVASRSSVSLVENFDAKPDTSKEIKPRYDDAASVFGPSPPKQQNDQTQQDETEETMKTISSGTPQKQSGNNGVEEVVEPLKEPMRPSRFSEIEDIVSESSRAVATRGYVEYEPSPPVRLRGNAAVSPETSDFLSASSSGGGAASSISVFSARLDQIKADVVAANGGKEFNPKSPKQVAEALYGKDGAEGQSTDRDTLEALASTGNGLADHVLRYRRCLRELRREEKRAENQANGNHVMSVGDMHNKRRGAASSGGGQSSQAIAQNLPPKKYPFDADALESDPLLLVDASAYIYRAYYSMPPLHRSDGTPVGAVLGFCNMLNRLVLGRMISGLRPRLALIFDAPGKTFRHDMYAEYKANRKSCPVDLIPQFGIIREAAEAYGIPQVQATGYEADDLIATLARTAVEEGVDVNILSGDKDLMQLVTPSEATPGIHMIDPMNMVHITHDTVTEKWGVPSNKLGDVLALAGDSSDNIPGVPGIGPKIAATLINDFGSLEEVLAGAESIKQKGRREKIMENVDKARLSRTLVELDQFVPLEKTAVPDNFACIGDIRMDPASPEKLMNFYDRMGFLDLKRRFEARLRSSNSSSLVIPLVLPDGEMSTGSGNSKDLKRSQEGPVAGGGVDPVSSGTGSSGLFVHQRNWASPPKPEEYSDVPF